MSRIDVLEKIMEQIEDIADIPQDEMEESSMLMDDLELSSLEIMTLIAELEKIFDVRIPEKSLRNLITIGDMADILA